MTRQGVNWTINVNEIGLIATSDWFQSSKQMFEGKMLKMNNNGFRYILIFRVI